jgi:subtilisin family serine protease
MKSPVLRVFAACLLAVASSVLAQSTSRQDAPTGIMVPPAAGATEGVDILIKFKDQADADEVEQQGTISVARRPGLAALFERYEISGAKRLFPGVTYRRLDRVVKLGAERLRQPGQLQEALRALGARPELEYAEPNVVLHALAVPNDPYYGSSGAWGQAFGDLWGLHAIGAEQAWNRTRGTGVVVAVLDTGIDFNHADVAANVWQNPGEIGFDSFGRDKKTNGLDDDGNGYADDWRGWDFTAGVFGNYPMDYHGHGTHVAGTIAAVGDNAVGILGVAPRARVMAVKVLGPNGFGTLEQIANGILYAARSGARVINASLGGEGDTPQTLLDAIAYAHDVKGVVFVAAAGNSGVDVGPAWTGTFPANMRNSVAVAAVDHLDQRASFSNRGAKIDLAAPGGGDAGTGFDPQRSILSLKSAWAGSSMTGSGQLVVGGQYLRQAGTSMAAPHVAGVAALVLALHPTYSPEQVRQVLRTAADDVGVPGLDGDFGYGRLNANRATSAPVPLATQLTEPARPFAAGAPPTVRGTVAGPGLLDWTLEYGSGKTPTAWTVLAAGTSAVTSAALATWSTTSLPDGVYTLRLTAHTSGGQVYEDRMEVLVDSLEITSPDPQKPQAYTAGDTITIKGTIAPANFSGYSVSVFGYRTGYVSPNIVLPNNGQQPVVNGTLASWNTTGLPADHYSVCFWLNGGSASPACVEIIVDPMLHPGWPKSIPALGFGGLTFALTDHLTAADLDGDGRQEILIGYDTQVHVLDGAGNELPGWPQSVDPFNNGWPIQKGPAVGDLTGDGIPEVVVVGYMGDVFVWSKDGVLLPGWPRPLLSQAFGSVAIDDVNGDGRNEIVATSQSIAVVDVNGQMLPGWPVSPGFGSLQPPAIGDVDGDGTKEIVVQGLSMPNPIMVFRANGAPVPGWPQPINTGASESSYSYPALGDLDGDGAAEIVVGTLDGRVLTFRGNGSMLPGWPQFTGAGNVNSPVIGDIDGDGLPEVVVGTRGVGPQRSSLFAWHANGTLLPGWPQQAEFNYAVFGYQTPALADVDGDGKADVIVSTDSAAFALEALRHNGTRIGDFPRPTFDMGAASTNSPLVADVDGDGSLELAWIDYRFNIFLWDLAAPATAVAPWPMFRHDAAHTARWTRATSPPSPSAIFSDDFESGTDQWSVTGADGTGGPALWHLSSLRSSSPSHAFYYGKESTHNYDTGASNFGAITSVPIDLAGAQGCFLTFNYFLQGEPSTFYDTGRVLISNNDGLSWIPLGAELPQAAAMTPMRLDLTPFDGQRIRIRFEFDTKDPVANAFEGWHVDDVVVDAAHVFNRRPVAKAGPDQTVPQWMPATLDGSASYDPEGFPLSYEWRDSFGMLVGVSPVMTLWLPPGIHEFTLTVSDGMLSASDKVRITVEGPLELRLEMVSFEGGDGVVSLEPPFTQCFMNPGGIPQFCSEFYPSGTSVHLVATPMFGSVFWGWGGACAPQGMMPTCDVQMAELTQVSATFRGSQELRLELQSFEGGRGKVRLDPRGMECTLDGVPIQSCSDFYTFATMVHLTAEPLPGSVFWGWGGPCAPQGLLQTCDVQVNALTEVMAIFRGPQELRLELQSFEGGRGKVRLDPHGMECMLDGVPIQSCNDFYTFATMVHLTAEPLPGSVFWGWNLDGPCASQGQMPTCDLQVMGLTQVRATFRGPQQLRVEMTRFEGGQGKIRLDPHGVECTTNPGQTEIQVCSDFYAVGTVVRVTAEPLPGSVFWGWNLDGPCASQGQTPTCDLQVTGLTQVAARFRGPQILELNLTGEGHGEVQLGAPAVPCQKSGSAAVSCSYPYAPGSAVSLTASASADALFQGWTGACAGQADVCSLTVNGPISTDAVFVLRNHPPVAAPGGPYSGFRNQPIAFDGSASSDPDGDALTYEWTFGDGTTATGAKPSRAFAPGQQTVVLRVFDGTVWSAAVSTHATIVNRRPTAHPGGPYIGNRTQPVVFDGTGSSDPDGDALSYEWSFGGGAPTPGATPSHTFAQLGTFEITLTVTDGIDPASATASVTIANLPPVVTLTSPAPGSSFTAPATVTLHATASDPDGSVTKVEFYQGTTKVGEDTVEPYEVSWAGAGAGTYLLTARVTDDSGASVDAAPVAITVNAPPQVALVAPANGSVVPGPTDVALAATASDADGSVSRVEFYQGTTKIGEDTSEPFAITWPGVSPGRYVLTARVIDDRGASVVSSPVTVTVTAKVAATADAYVRDGSSAGSNFGQSTALTVQRGSSASGNNRWTYVKFNLSSVPSIANAKLRLFGRLSATTGTSIQTAVFSVSNTTWTENGLTWNNKPASGSTALAVVPLVNSTTARWYEWDVSAYLQQEKAAGRNVITLALKNVANSAPFATFNSDEATTNKPELFIVP